MWKSRLTNFSLHCKTCPGYCPNTAPLDPTFPLASCACPQLALLPNNTTPDDQGRRWVLLVNNISLAAAGQWPEGPARNTTSTSDARAGLEGTPVNPSNGSCGDGSCDAAAAPAGNDTGAGVQVPGLTVIASLIPETPVRLGLGWRLSALGVPGGAGAGLVVRNLVVSELAARGGSYSRSDPLAVLSSPLWGVSLAAGASKTRLENCTLVVSAEELRLLQQALLPAAQLAAVGVPGPAGGTSANATANGTEGSGSPQRPFDSTLAAAARAFFVIGDDLLLGPPSASRLVFVRGSAARFSLSNVTFRRSDPGSGEQANAGLTALGVPYDDGSSSGSGVPVGAIAGAVVGGCVLLLMVGGAAWLSVRRRQGQGSYQEKELFTSGDLEQLGNSTPAAAGVRSGASDEGVSGSRGMHSGFSAAQRRRQLQSSLTGSSPMLPCIRRGRSSLEMDILRAKGVAKGEAGGLGGPSNSPATRSGSDTQSVRVSGPSAMFPGLAISGASPGDRASVAPGNPAAQAPEPPQQAGLREPPAGPVTATGTDSFNRPPTLTMSHHTLQRPGQSHGSGAATLQRSGGGSTGAASTSAAAAGSTTGSEPAHDSQSRSRGAALEQMRGTIAALGRDFAGDQQLHVHGLIGKGAHGTVYRGTWRGLSVAIKSMVFGPDDHARHQQRPLMEAAISSNLTHPNIV